MAPIIKGKLLYMGDATERKGAREFLAVAQELGVKPTVISPEWHDMFRDTYFHMFRQEEQTAMFELIKSHTVAYIASKNECPGLVVLECLQFIPVVVNGDYGWTRDILAPLDVGATIVPASEIVATLRRMLTAPAYYNPWRIHRYSERSRQAWLDITNGSTPTQAEIHSTI